MLHLRGFAGVLTGLFAGMIFLAPARAQPAAMEILGNPFTDLGVYSRNVWDMEVFDGRLFLGYGNSSSSGPDRDAGPIPVVAFDGTTETFVVEDYVINEEQIEKFRLIGGRLFVPGHDATDNPQSTGAIYARESGGGWSQRKNIPGAFHVYDLLEFDDAWFVSLGTSGGGNSPLYRSVDQGVTWQDVTAGIDDIALASRVYTLCVAGGELYAFYATFSGGQLNYRFNAATGQFVTASSLTTARVFPGYNPEFSTARPRPVRPTEFGGRLVYIGGASVNDHQWDPVGLWHTADFSSSTRVPLPTGAQAWDMLVEGGELHVLLAEPDGVGYRVSIRKTADLTTWTEVLWFPAPAAARSFARYDGQWYFGLGSGESPINQACGDIWRTADAGSEPEAAAIPVFNEEFDHASGTLLDGLSGGGDSGWAGPWKADQAYSKIATGAFTYPGLVSGGERVEIRGSATRFLSQTPGRKTESIWFVAVLRSTNSARTATFSLTDDAGPWLWVTHQPGADVKLDGILTGVPSESGLKFVLGRVDFRPSGASAQIWVNPDLSGGEEGLGAAHAIRGYPLREVSGVRLNHSSTSSHSSEFAMVRLGPTFEAVITGEGGETPENPPPVAVIDSPMQVTANTSVVFNGSGSSDPDDAVVSWTWDFGDGVGGEGSQVTHTFESPGTYDVRLTVEDADGGRGQAIRTIQVAAAPAPVATANPSTALVGEAILFDGTASTAPPGASIVAWFWQFPDGGTTATATVERAFASTGEKVVSLTVTDSNGVATSTTVTVLVTDQPASGLLAYEGFNVDGGSQLDGLNGGSGWAAPWAATSISSAVVSGGYAFAGVESGGNRSAILGQGNRVLADPIAMSQGTIWVGTFIRSSNSARTATFSLVEGDVSRLAVTHKPGSEMTMTNSTGAAIDSTSTQRFVLLRIDFAPAGNTVRLWVDPDLSAGEPALASAQRVAQFAENWGITGVRINHSSTSSHVSNFDEIRIGMTFADAISGTTTSPSNPPTPYAVWKDEYFEGQANDPAVSGDLVDADLDGVVNLLEYALGTNPTVWEVPNFGISVEAGGPPAFEFFRARSDMTYIVRTSPDLVDWADLATNPGAVGEWVSVAIEGEPDARFFRLVVVPTVP